jgi:ferredoxin
VQFLDVQKLFPEDAWDVGLLTKEQLKIVSYCPIKWKSQLDEKTHLDFTNFIHFSNIVNTLVLVRHSVEPFEYSLYEEATKILSDSGLEGWHHIYTNFKEAQILSGLGVRAKNSLVYNYKFGFDSKICAIGFIEEITDPPLNRRINKKYWQRCKGCDDCRIACPVGAIHNEEEPYWLDSAKCDNFLGYSDHPTIPSIKKFWHENVHPEIPKEMVDKITGHLDIGHLPFDANGYTNDDYGTVRRDGKQIPVPFCRECQVQPRCSKWHGNYPYK